MCVFFPSFFLATPRLICPGHDYKGRSVSSVLEERRFNPRLNEPLDEFVSMMEHMNLPKPPNIDAAVPGNLNDGEQHEPYLWDPEFTALHTAVI